MKKFFLFISICILAGLITERVKTNHLNAREKDTEVFSVSHLVPSNTSLRKQHWVQFVNHFGDHLLPQFSSSGYLVGAQGKVDTLSRFSLSEEDIHRLSHEILDFLKNLIGLHPDFPLDRGQVRLGPITAQIFFQEMHQDMPVLPGGQVKLDFGSQGELIGLDSSSLPCVYLEEMPDMGLSSARLKAVEFFTKTHSTRDHPTIDLQSLSVTAGRRVIWVESEKGRISYQFNVQGREMIIDAHQGEVLYFHDQRQLSFNHSETKN